MIVFVFFVVVVTGEKRERGEEKGYCVERNGNCEGTGMGMAKNMGLVCIIYFIVVFSDVFFCVERMGSGGDGHSCCP